MRNYIMLLAVLCIFYGCNQNNDNKEQYSSTNDTTINNISSSAAKQNNKDSTRKFIRTADVKFRVKNVIDVTYSIENICDKEGGFVTYTNLSSNNFKR